MGLFTVSILALIVACCASGQTYTIDTFAGNGTAGFAGDGGPAASAQLSQPWGVALDSAGNLYIADWANSRIRKVSNGVISTLAGNGLYGFSGDNGLATGAQLYNAMGVALDSAGNLYIADWDNQRVRKVSNGVITTVAGSGLYGFSGDNGPATSAMLDNPTGVAADAFGNLYIADNWNHRIRKVSDGAITTMAGSGPAAPSLGGFGGDNGPAASAQLDKPYGIAVDAAGSVYIADTDNSRIRKVSNGVISTLAGNGLYGFGGDDGPAASAQLHNPEGVAVDAAGNVYIADTFNHRIRKVSNGVITTIAGNGTAGYSGDNGPATSAQLYNPEGVAVDAAGNVYIGDAGNNRIRVLRPATAIPQINAGGVVNGASFTASVVPGSIAAVLGSFFVASASDTDLPLDTSLQNLSFQFGSDAKAPLFFVSGGQVGLQVPWELAGQLTTTLAATLNSQTGAAQTVNIEPFAPAIFAIQGAGQGAILDSSYYLVDSSHPASAGTTIVLIYCTGLGAVTNQPATGSPGPDSPLAWTTRIPTVTIGGVPAAVLFYGLAPGFVGLYQVNAIVPAGLDANSATPVVVSMGGVNSNTVTIAVH